MVIQTVIADIEGFDCQISTLIGRRYNLDASSFFTWRGLQRKSALRCQVTRITP